MAPSYSGDQNLNKRKWQLYGDVYPQFIRFLLNFDLKKVFKEFSPIYFYVRTRAPIVAMPFLRGS